MKVGYKTSLETKGARQFEELPQKLVSPQPVDSTISIIKQQQQSMEQKYLVWHIEGGLGKNVAATSLLALLVEKYPDRKLVVVASYPEVFLNNPHIYRVYRVGMTPYFYDDYILGKDTLVFRQEPYFQSGHILKQKHLIQNWMDLLGLTSTEFPNPELKFNMIQNQLSGNWKREKPVCVIQTNGGPLENQAYTYSWTRDLPIDWAVYIANKLSPGFHIIQVTRPNSPQIPGAEVVTNHMTASELFSLLQVSEKRILIDSCLQHAAAAFGLSSFVFWVGTSPENFGYSLHSNIKALPPKGETKMVDSYLFDYSFDGVLHECPYQDVNDMFDPTHLEQIFV